MCGDIGVSEGNTYTYLHTCRDVGICEQRGVCTQTCVQELKFLGVYA